MSDLTIDGFDTFHRRDWNTFAGAVKFSTGQDPLIKYVDHGGDEYVVLIGGSECTPLDVQITVSQFSDDMGEFITVGLHLTDNTTIKLIVEHLVTLDFEGAYYFLESLGGFVVG